jgi:RNA polymerase-binding transcription factor DksA
MPHAAYCVDCQEAVERDGVNQVSSHEGVPALVGQ